MIKIYYINLECSNKRKLYMNKTYPTSKRIEAYDGIKLDTYKNIQYPKNTKQTNNELACSLSHIKAIIEAYNDNCEKAIILEDDIKHIVPLTIIEKKIQEYPKDTECIQLFISNIKEVERMSLLKNNYELWNSEKWSTGAYCIFRKGMEKIINKFYKDNIINIDIPLHNYVADNGILYNNIKTYSYTKPLFINMLFDSAIKKGDNSRKKIEKEIHFFISNYIKKNYKK